MPTPTLYPYHKSEKDGKFVCDTPGCGKRLARGKDVARHAKTAGHPRLRAPQEESPYWYKHETTNEPTCKACGRSFTRGHDAERHFENLHREEAKRIQAQLEKDDATGPDSHSSTMDDDLMSTLREEGFGRIQSPSVTKGSRKYKYHKGDDERWYCDERCNRSFGSASAASRHCQTCSVVSNVERSPQQTSRRKPEPNASNFPCTLCDKHYLNPKHLYRHYRTNHPDTDPETYQVSKKGKTGHTSAQASARNEGEPLESSHPIGSHEELDGTMDFYDYDMDWQHLGPSSSSHFDTLPDAFSPESRNPYLSHQPLPDEASELARHTGVVNPSNLTLRSLIKPRPARPLSHRQQVLYRMLYPA